MEMNDHQNRNYGNTNNVGNFANENGNQDHNNNNKDGDHENDLESTLRQVYVAHS
jgi:hypothetical protein